MLVWNNIKKLMVSQVRNTAWLSRAICNSDLNVKMVKLCYSFCSSVNDKSPMESYEAAQAIFPTLSRALQKYLRTTRQQPRYVEIT